MEYSYEYILDGLNSGKIKSVAFSVKGYGHYKHCNINCYTDVIESKVEVIRIELMLTRDGSERIDCYKKFKDDNKIFKLGKKGSFTLKQIWKDVEILDVKLNELV